MNIHEAIIFMHIYIYTYTDMYRYMSTDIPTRLPILIPFEQNRIKC